MGRVDELPFVGKRRPDGEPGRHFWRVSPSGNYERDSESGIRLGFEFLVWMSQNKDDACVLPWIVRDMPRKLGGIEISFLTMIATAAIDRDMAFKLWNPTAREKWQAQGGRC